MLQLIIKNDILAGNMPVTLGVGTDILQCNNDSHLFRKWSLTIRTMHTAGHYKNRHKKNFFFFGGGGGELPIDETCLHN